VVEDVIDVVEDVFLDGLSIIVVPVQLLVELSLLQQTLHKLLLNDVIEEAHNGGTGFQLQSQHLL
jgi:hypothetical protein